MKEDSKTFQKDGQIWNKKLDLNFKDSQTPSINKVFRR